MFLHLATVVAQEIKIDTTENAYIVEIRAGAPSFKVIKTGDSIPVLPNSEYIFEKGAPDLLKISLLFNAFTQQGLEIEIINDFIFTINADIAPSRGFIYQNNPIPHRIRGDLYKENNFFPKEILKEFPTADQKDKKLQNFWIHFMQYNPVTKELLLHSYLKIKFKFKKPTYRKSTNSTLIKSLAGLG